MAIDTMARSSARIRLDHALVADLRTAATSPALVLMGVLEVVAALVFVARRGTEVVSTVLLVWLALGFVAFIAWWAGRHRLARPEPDPVPRARGRLLAGLTLAFGLAIGTWNIDRGASGAIALLGLGGWLVLALPHDSGPGLGQMLRRSWRPFGPLLLLVIVPRALIAGLTGVGPFIAGVTSGVLQQLMFLPMLFCSMEAVLGRRSTAAVLSALVFATIHVPMNLSASGGDWVAAAANAVFYQATVGLIACLAYTRHRAAVPIGVAHGLIIA